MENSVHYLGIMLRCHRRAQYLPIILEEFRRLSTLPGVALRVHALLDRPTPEVQQVVHDYSNFLWGISISQHKILSPTGEAFNQAQNQQLATFEASECEWYSIWDDDYWFEPLHITAELPPALANPDVDMWYAERVAFWEADTPSYNPHRHHCSPIFWRHTPGDRFPLNRTILAPAQVHDRAIIQDRTATLKTPLLDYGVYTAEERRLTYEAYREAGKDDPFTRAGLEVPPRLFSFPADAVPAYLPDPNWIDLWTTAKTRSQIRSSAPSASAKTTKTSAALSPTS